MDGSEWAGKRVTIIGLAREGVALAQYLAPRGARVTVNDRKSVDELRDAVEALTPYAVRFVLGGHPEEVLDCDELFVSPGVPLDIPLLQEARRRGLPLSGESRFFLEHCPASVIGVTGSSGKTTTVQLTGEMLRAAGFRTWVGGNIGQPLTPHLDEIAAEDKVVMELSSFQLQIMRQSPAVAAVLNITPNHLDRHPSMADYIEAKRNILRFQRAGDSAVLGYDNPVTRGMAGDVRGRLAFFSLAEAVDEGAFLRGERLVLRLAGRERDIVPRRDIGLRGDHNVANVLAACVIAGLAGAEVEAMAEAIRAFHGVEHRLELVRELDGVRYYNDSIATSPERAAAALRSFDEPLVVLAGGQDKHLPWDELADLMCRRARAVIAFGQAGDLVVGALAAARQRAEAGHGPAVRRVASLEEAVAAARELAQPGDVVLLAPGGTSFDAYRDFVQRGEHFRSLVGAL